MSYVFRSCPSSYSIFAIWGNVEKNNSGLRICKLYVEKKIFYSLVFSLEATVWVFKGFLWFRGLKTRPNTFLPASSPAPADPYSLHREWTLACQVPGLIFSSPEMDTHDIIAGIDEMRV
jgi:hypothetical protein